MAKHIVFDRYTFVQAEENQRLFYEVLSMVPIIEENNEILTIITKEINFIEERERDRDRNHIDKKKGIFVETDYNKKQKLLKFKEKMETHLRE